MINTGIGETQLNNLLAAMNLPVLSKSSLKKRENEAGMAIEEVVTISSDNAIEEEKSLL